MNTIHVSTAAEWRSWLTGNRRSAKEVWLVIHHRDSATPSPSYQEAIEHALCFGWIDGLHRKHDEHSSRLRFTPRGPRSTWSRVNRERAARLIERGLMTEDGLAAIERAKARGTWQVCSDDVGSTVPGDLRDPLDRNPVARANFERFPPSSKRLILEWIAAAKKPETRQRRIARTVGLAAVNVRANHPGTATGRAT